MATPSDIAAANAAGYLTPTGDSLIREGDNAITENAVLAFLQRWYQGPAGTSGLDGFTTGSRGVGGGPDASALGLPVAFPGVLETYRFAVSGLQVFTTFEDRPQIWTRHLTTTGWQPWMDDSPVLYAPNGTRYRVLVSNTGILSTVAF